MWNEIRPSPPLNAAPHMCQHCEGKGWLVRDPYLNQLPCSECSGRGYVMSLMPDKESR